MTSSPRVVFRLEGNLALNNPDRKNTNVNKIIKATTGMFDYFGNEEKKVINMFDYFDGTLTKDKHINIMLENGKYATKEDIEKRKKDYVKYIENSNIWKCIISFENDYLLKNSNYEKLQVDLVKEILPMFFKKMGFDKIENMSYQIALHSDTDNLHYHFSFIEKKPNFKYTNKIDFRREFKIDIKDINFLKSQIVHSIEKNSLYTSTLIKTNNKIEDLKKYFDKDDKNFILQNKKDLELENKIYYLGEKLYLKELGNNGKIKYNSINDKEIKDLVKDVKKYIFKNADEEFKNDYTAFKNNINILNNYFKKISIDNQIKDYVNNDLTKNKEKYLNNFILNRIVNYANDNYRLKTLKENNIIKEIIVNKYKDNDLKDRYNILKDYLSNPTNKLINKYEIEKAIKSINYEMQESIKEFRKMFDYDIQID